MTDATRKGVSPQAPPAAQRPESDAVFDNTQEGAEDIQVSQEVADATSTADEGTEGHARNPRDNAIDDMHARFEAQRRQELIAAGQPVPPIEEDPGTEEAPAAEAAPEEEKDPLEEFTVIRDGKRMFRTVINGKETLIPFERARDQLQKAEAAEVRMARAAEYEKGLKLRENQILANEQALNSRLQSLAKPPPAPAGEAGKTTEQIGREAQELVSALFTGTQEQAAAKMTKILADANRVPVVPAIDPEEIGRRAVTAAKQQLSEEATTADVGTGYKKFGEDYPEILADQNLFRYADSLTDTIAEENPTWMPSQVMLEAGKRTRAWVHSMKSPAPTPPTNGRQSRKDGLVPMPRATSARRETAQPVVVDNSPRSALADIRKSRGQAA